MYFKTYFFLFFSFFFFVQSKKFERLQQCSSMVMRHLNLIVQNIFMCFSLMTKIYQLHFFGGIWKEQNCFLTNQTCGNITIILKEVLLKGVMEGNMSFSFVLFPL